jgi:hypothetical protein
MVRGAMSSAWNHQNYAVAPGRLKQVEEAIDGLFGWRKFVTKPHLVGYLVADDFNAGAVYFQPAAAVEDLERALARLRSSDAELAAALAEIERLDVDLADHSGVMLATVEEWEACVSRARELERSRPDLEIRVIEVVRPGDARAATPDLHQAFIRIGLLGEVRNTLEVQARSR